LEPRRKLLLADDSITIQKVVNLTFVDEGFEVKTVGNGNLAIEKIEELLPDIVLADVHMPGPNGYEVCEFVKRNERFRHIPVMLLVGSFEPYDEAEARRVGADDHLTKPFQSIRQLVNRIGALLSGTASGDEPSSRNLAKSEDVQNEAYEQHEVAMAATEPLSADTLEPDALTSDLDDDAFADPSLDDAMIQATSAEDLSIDRTMGASKETTPLSSSNLDQALANRSMPTTIHTQDTLNMHPSDLEVESSQAPSASKHATDDALLDLGDDEPQLTHSKHEDEILDIWDDAPAQAEVDSSESAESPVVQYDGAVTEDITPHSEPINATVLEADTDSTPQYHVDSDAVSAEPAVDGMSSPRVGLITLDQLSPEVIDAIARRAVEQLSEKVIEQIAWEVVPELAERLIKRRLDEENKT
jgi:CheY-like chemotaxis protein